ncbi:MAG TPA: ABC transporter permease [Pyrinomonadaceae bacterium]|nr:ABC transporter permease [Pyrinomonadaceae bacterium]
MRKFFAVVKHEYRKVVLRWSFVIGTLLFPLLGAGFAVVPALIFSLKGEATRIVIVDQAGKIGPRIRSNLSPEKLAQKQSEALKNTSFEPNVGPKNSTESLKGISEGFVFVPFETVGKTEEQIRSELNSLAAEKEIDAYLLVPQQAGGKFEFLSRKAGDFVAAGLIEDAVNDAVRAERLTEANISETTLRQINQKAEIETKAIDEHGREKNSDALLAASFVIGLMIYISLTIYGQVILGAVVEEKETRIAEILFSSAKPFELMLGKLVGVGLAGLTQLGIWVTSLALLVGFLMLQTDLAPFLAGAPHITPLMVVYFLLFFLLGYFLFASIFALIGSMVTTVQEGGQFAFPPIMLMLIGFYFSFAVIRDPSSPLSFWVSIAPFWAPITMPVRILAETPPFWQIALSISVNAIAICGMVWLCARVYRVGMLMYGKRATLPEVWKWIRES